MVVLMHSTLMGINLYTSAWKSTFMGLNLLNALATQLLLLQYGIVHTCARLVCIRMANLFYFLRCLQYNKSMGSLPIQP